MTKLLKMFMNCIFIIIIILLATYFFFRVTNKVEIYNVKTGSMEEKIHVGDYILILRKKEYNVGDVVTYTSNNGFITHRIIKKDGNTVTTKGDANNTADETINASIIVGKVIISGGILNFVINYKYVLAGVVLSLYLFSCYFGSGDEKEEDLVLEDSMLEENKEDKKNDEVENVKKEELTETSIKENVKENSKEEDNGSKENTETEKAPEEKIKEDNAVENGKKDSQEDKTIKEEPKDEVETKENKEDSLKPKKETKKTENKKKIEE